MTDILPLEELEKQYDCAEDYYEEMDEYILAD